MNDLESKFGDVVGTALLEKMTPEYIQQQVDAHAKNLVDGIIRDAMREYGDIGKEVKRAVQESLKVSDLDLPSYGNMVSSMLKQQIETTVSPLIAGQLAEDMEHLLNLAPKEIRLSEIVETMVEEKDSSEYGELCTCIVEHNEYGSTWIYLDEEVIEEESTYLRKHTERKKYHCSVKILIGSDGTISSARFSGDDIKTMRSVGIGTYGLEQKIRSYYACGTVIEVDEDAVCTSREYD